MAITFANLGVSANPDINNNVDATSYANTSWTPPTADLIVVFVANRVAGAVPNAPTVSGNSLTWTQIATVTTATRRLTLFAANASGSSTGATTFDCAGQTQTNFFVSFFHVLGADLSGGVLAAFVQSPTNTSTGTSGSVTLAAAGHADNRPVAGFMHNANEATTPDAAWTEVDDLANSAQINALETQWDADGFQNASASWATSSEWLGIAAEIKAAGAGAPPTSGFFSFFGP